MTETEIHRACGEVLDTDKARSCSERERIIDRSGRETPTEDPLPMISILVADVRQNSNVCV